MSRRKVAEKAQIKAVILAGGLGTRLRPYTFFIPKPMLPLGEKPVLEHLIEWLRENGVKDIVVAVAYLRRVIEEYFRNGRELGVKITYARSRRPLGIAGQLKSVEKYLDRTFLCLYGDALYNFDLHDALNFHKEKMALTTMILMPYKTRLSYGFIEVDREKRVKRWREKPEVRGLINVGCYIMEPRFLKYIPKDEMYGMDAAFRTAIKSGEPIYGFKVRGEFVDIGDRKTYVSAYEKYLKKLGRIL